LYLKSKKHLPNASRALEPRDVNSGVSIPVHRVCVIYRQEEMHKVIVHELMHIWGVDCASSAQKDLVVQHKLGITCDLNGLRLGEAYNDALACLYLVALRIYFKHGLTDFYDHWAHEQSRGQKWTASVAGNVIRYYDRIGKWQEKTHVFAYYIGKAAIFTHLTLFDTWLKTLYGSFDCPDFYKFIDPLMNPTTIEKLRHSHDISCPDLSLRMFCKAT